MNTLDTIFNDLLTNVSNDITVASALLTMAVALLFGALIAFTYYKTQDAASYRASFAVTLLMLPVILSVIIVFVGSNIARAFSLAGTLAIIRFRSAPGDPKDIGFIFFSVAAGLACGVGLYGYGFLFVALLCLALVIVQKGRLFEKKDVQKLLKITIPEDLHYEGVFDEVLKKYTKTCEQIKIRTTDLGSLFEVQYLVTVPAGKNEQDFLNELRVRNGNLNIVLSTVPKVVD